MTTQEPLHIILRQAADALRTAEQAAEYFSHPPHDGNYGLRIDWSWGSSNAESKAGYSAIREKVTLAFTAQLPELMRAAVEDLLNEAMAKKRSVKEALK